MSWRTVIILVGSISLFIAIVSVLVFFALGHWNSPDDPPSMNDTLLINEVFFPLKKFRINLFPLLFLLIRAHNFYGRTVLRSVKSN